MRPSYQWNNQHGVKIRHRTRLGAWLHRRRLERVREIKYNVYECRWTDDYHEGKVGRRHWHVGRQSA